MPVRSAVLICLSTTQPPPTHTFARLSVNAASKQAGVLLAEPTSGGGQTGTEPTTRIPPTVRVLDPAAWIGILARMSKIPKDRFGSGEQTARTLVREWQVVCICGDCSLYMSWHRDGKQTRPG